MKVVLFSLLGFFALVIVVVGITIIAKMNIESTQISLNEQYKAQLKVEESVEDNMWKQISQKYTVADAYKDGFIKSVNAVVQGREGGSLIKMVQEQMPGLSDDIYKDVEATIEGKRDEMNRANQMSADIAREYNTYVMSPWHGWALADTAPINAQIITSGRAQQSIQTGQDNDVSLMGSSTKP